MLATPVDVPGEAAGSAFDASVRASQPTTTAVLTAWIFHGFEVPAVNERPWEAMRFRLKVARLCPTFAGGTLG